MRGGGASESFGDTLGNNVMFDNCFKSLEGNHGFSENAQGPLLVLVVQVAS